MVEFLLKCLGWDRPIQGVSKRERSVLLEVGDGRPPSLDLCSRVAPRLGPRLSGSGAASLKAHDWGPSLWFLSRKGSLLRAVRGDRWGWGLKQPSWERGSGQGSGGAGPTARAGGRRGHLEGTRVCCSILSAFAIYLFIHSTNINTYSVPGIRALTAQRGSWTLIHHPRRCPFTTDKPDGI